MQKTKGGGFTIKFFEYVRKNPKTSALLAGLLIIAVLIPFWNYGCEIYEEKLIDEERERLHHQFSYYSNSLTYSMNEKLGLIDGVYSFVIAETDKERLDFSFIPFASALHSGHPDIKAIGAAPGGVFTYIYPEEGNEGVIGYDMLNDSRPDIARQNEYLFSGKPTVLRGPVKLIQGTEGIVTTKAVFLNGTYKDGDFWGFVSMSVDMQSIYDNSGISEIPGFLVALKNDDYDVFYGDRSVLDKSPGIYEMTIGNEIWTFAVAPEDGWEALVESESSVFRNFSFILVILSAILGGYLVYSYLWLNKAFLRRTGELEKAEEELLFRDLAIDTSVSPVVISDETGRIVYMNKAALKIWNIEHKAAKKRQFSSLVRDPRFISDFLDGTYAVESRFGEAECIRDDGSSFFVYGSITAVRDKFKRFHGLHGSFIDITDIRELRNREKEALKQIEKNLLRLAALNDEIRNPLAVIVGYSSMLENDLSEKIIQQAKIIDRLINQLDQSWVESEKIRDYLKKYHGIEKEKK